MSRAAILTAVATLAINGLFGGTARAAILDQDNHLGTFGIVEAPSGPIYVQTVTAGMAGYLDGILVEVVDCVGDHGNGFVAFSLYEGDPTEDPPPPTPMFTENIDMTPFGGNFIWDVSSQNFALNSGDVFAFGMAGLRGGGARFAADVQAQYEGGSFSVSSASSQFGDSWQPAGDLDFATFVSPIPEPSTLLLAIVALGVVGGWRKRAA